MSKTWLNEDKTAIMVKSYNNVIILKDDIDPYKALKKIKFSLYNDWNIVFMSIFGIAFALSTPILLSIHDLLSEQKLILLYFVSFGSFIGLLFIGINTYLFEKKLKLFTITPNNFISFNYLTKKQRDVLAKAYKSNKDYVWSTALAEVESELNKKLKEVQAPARNEAKIIVDELFTVD